MMGMRALNSIILVLLAEALVGCLICHRGEARAPSESDSVCVQSAGLHHRIPPRIRRWLESVNIDFRQDVVGKGIYRLTLNSAEPMSADQREYIQEYFRSLVAESFAKSNALELQQVAVVVLSEKLEQTVYCGEATAYGCDDISMVYDSDKRKGTLAMKIRNGDFDGTRKLIRQHIEGIVRDKNIRLIAGVQPPPGRYYLLGETVKPGNVLEVEFKSE